MQNADTLITIFGGSGFLGREVTRALAEHRYRLRIAVRHPYLTGHVQPPGRLGEIDVVRANVCSPRSVTAAVHVQHARGFSTVCFQYALPGIGDRLLACAPAAKGREVLRGSGFLGREVVRALARHYRLRIAVRHPRLTGHPHSGGLGEIQAVRANVCSPRSVTAAVRDAEIVINLVGILVEDRVGPVEVGTNRIEAGTAIDDRRREEPRSRSPE